MKRVNLIDCDEMSCTRITPGFGNVLVIWTEGSEVSGAKT